MIARSVVARVELIVLRPVLPKIAAPSAEIKPSGIQPYFAISYSKCILRLSGNSHLPGASKKAVRSVYIAEDRI